MNVCDRTARCHPRRRRRRGLLTDPADTAAYSEDWRRLYQGRTPAVVRPADTARSPTVVRLVRAAGVPIVPQGGNTSMVGGATPDADGSADRAQPGAAEPCARDRPGRPDDDHRGRRHAESRAERRRRRRLPAAAVDFLGGLGADRRRARDQRRRQQHRALRQRARPGARAGGRAGRRAGVERAAPAAQGQHRLLPAPALRRLRGHARRHHRRGAEAGAAAA